MVFSSLTFLLIFLPVLLLLYFLRPGWRWRNGVLVAASLLFYGWGEPVWILAMLFSTAVNYLCAKKLDGVSVPKRRKLWLALGVVMSVAFDYPAIAVDTHVFRVANRLKLAVGTTPLEVEKGLQKVIPKEKWSAAHHWLIWHGRKLCRARNPLCADCPLSEVCPSAAPGQTRK